MALNHHIGTPLRKERRLHSDPDHRIGIPVEQQFLDRVVGHGVCVIAVRIASSDFKGTLPNEVLEAMQYLTGLARIAQSAAPVERLRGSISSGPRHSG